MIYFVIEPLSDLVDGHLLLATAELHALTGGTFEFADWDIDHDSLTTAFIESADPDVKEGMIEEPLHARAMLKEYLESLVIEAAREADAAMGAHYPFLILPRPGVLLEAKMKEEIDEFAWCYIALQMFLLDQDRLISFGTILPEPIVDARLYSRRAMFALFEVIAGITVANSRHGFPVFFSSSRSSQKLLRRIKYACKIFGRGTPKSADLLHPVEADANDAGVDVVVGEFGPTGLFHTTLVGATVQEGQLRSKRIGDAEIRRLMNYLVNQLHWYPTQGVLVHPQPFDEGTRYRCAEANCGYMSREDIVQNLRPLPSTVPKATAANRSMRALARTGLLPLKPLHMQVEFTRLPLL